MQKAYVKKLLDMSQTKILDSKKVEYSVLLSNLKTQCGNKFRNKVLDDMINC